MIVRMYSCTYIAYSIVSVVYILHQMYIWGAIHMPVGMTECNEDGICQIPPPTSNVEL